MKFSELEEFKKDLKKLLKRYRTLNDDIETVIKVLDIKPEARPPFSFQLEGLGLKTCVIKVKKIACKALRGKGVNTGLRLVYAHFEETQEIVLIELFHKNDKENEDRDRVKKNFE